MQHRRHILRNFGTPLQLGLCLVDGGRSLSILARLAHFAHRLDEVLAEDGGRRLGTRHLRLDAKLDHLVAGEVCEGRDKESACEHEAIKSGEEPTVDAVAVRVHRAEPSAKEPVSGAQPARREDPFLALGEERIVEQRVALAFAQEEAEAEEVAVDAAPRRRLFRVEVVRLCRGGQQLVARLGL